MIYAILVFRCDCPKGITRADGSCITSATLPPTNVIYVRGSRRSSTESAPTTTKIGFGSGVVAGPVITCLLIFLGFCVIMIIITYSFRVRSRCLAMETRRRSVTSSNLHRGSFAGDLPPSYSSILPPPSYEQAIIDVTALSSPSTEVHNRYSVASTSASTAPLMNRYSTISSSSSSAAGMFQGGCPSRVGSTEMKPFTISSPGMSSSDSYGSILTRSFLLTPSDHSPSLTDLTTTDLTAANLYKTDDATQSLPRSKRY